MIFFFFFHSTKHCSKEQEKCSFSFCVGENRGQVSEDLPCLGGTLPAPADTCGGDSMEPFVPQTHRASQSCGGLAFVCCCPLGAKKTPEHCPKP